MQEISDLQERSLQRALKKLEDLRARSVEPTAEQLEALTLLRESASEVLHKWWPEDTPPNEWNGVVFREGQVSKLHLTPELESLPAEVGGLRALTSLDLSNSALTTLPAAVGGLRALTSLKLGGTGLKTLPVEVGGLRALTSLNLGGITAPMTLPAEVGGLRALTSLDLSYTDLATLPVEVGGLRALISLNLRECTALKLLPEKIHEEDLIAIRAHLVSAFVKDWANNPKVAQRLHDYPNMLHALAEEPAAANFLCAVFEADPTLADITKGDLNGNTPIDHACPQCRRAMRTALCLLGRFEIDDGPPLHFSATSAVVQANHFVDAEGSSGADAKPLRRALKAMRETTQVLAELNGREGPDSKY